MFFLLVTSILTNHTFFLFVYIFKSFSIWTLSCTWNKILTLCLNCIVFFHSVLLLCHLCMIQSLHVYIDYVYLFIEILIHRFSPLSFCLSLSLSPPYPFISMVVSYISVLIFQRITLLNASFHLFVHLCVYLCVYVCMCDIYMNMFAYSFIKTTFNYVNSVHYFNEIYDITYLFMHSYLS